VGGRGRHPQIRVAFLKPGAARTTAAGVKRVGPVVCGCPRRAGPAPPKRKASLATPPVHSLDLRVQGGGPGVSLTPQGLGFTPKPETRSVFPVALHLPTTSSRDSDHVTLNLSSPNKGERRETSRAQLLQREHEHPSRERGRTARPPSHYRDRPTFTFEHSHCTEAGSS